jgi:hypothetical protein
LGDLEMLRELAHAGALALLGHAYDRQEQEMLARRDSGESRRALGRPLESAHRHPERRHPPHLFEPVVLGHSHIVVRDVVEIRGGY